MLFLPIAAISAEEAFQTTKPVVCDSTKKLLDQLKNKWNEKLVWYGKDGNNESRYALFVNSKTGSWTILQMSTEISCVLGVGENSNIVSDSTI